MKLSVFKKLLQEQSRLTFQLANGDLVPSHFHVTEVGKVLKHFIDCGGTERLETKINFQLWSAADYDHQLHPEKLLQIVALAERQLGLPDAEIEVEYQDATIGKYHLDHDGTHFLLSSTATDCLAKDACGIPEEKPKVKLSEIQAQNTCAPGSGCC